MIKSINTEPKPDDYFPRIMRHTETGSIVLFLTEDSGIYLETTECSNNPTGTYIIDAFMVEDWESYNEPVTIQNV